jgi:putative ABC transport system permease protein
MHGVAPLLRLALVRIMANRVLLATVALGVIFSSALMSTVILYTDAVRDLGLKHILEGKDQASLDVRIASSGHPASAADYARRRDYTTDTLRAYLGGQLSGIQLAARSDTLYLAGSGEAPRTDDGRPRSHFVFVSGMSQHVRTLEGPTFGEKESDPNTIEAWVSKDTADRLGVKTGDSFDLYPFWRNDNSHVPATVAGIIEPEDPGSDYWRGRRDWYTEDTTAWPTYVFLITEESYVGELAKLVPDIDGSYETFGLIDTGSITSGNAKSVENASHGLESVLRENIERTTVQTALPDVLAEFSAGSFFTRVPLFALMIQVVGIVLYYLVMVATMVVERQSGEIALLRARGATSAQIMALFGIEAAIICLVLGLGGPLFAALGISALGLTPPFQDLSGNSLLDVRLTPAAFAMGWAGAVIAFAAMLIPAYRAARLSIVEHQRAVARPPKQPVFLRYSRPRAHRRGGTGVLPARQNDSLVSERLFGAFTDPLLLISPTLFMLRSRSRFFACFR